MAALMRLRVVPSKEATYEVNVTPKVIVGAERQFAKPMSQIFGENASFEALCWTAWKASQSAGIIVKPFDEWLDEIDSIEAAEAERVPLEIQ
jgi:hypothetical protein